MKMTMNKKAKTITKKKGSRRMNSNEKIYVKSYAAYTTEDIFGCGEVGFWRCAWSSRDNRIDGVFNTIEDALEAVCRENCFDYVPANCHNAGRDIPEEAGRFDISVMVDADNCEATKHDIEEWKAGRKRLWSCQITVYLGVCTQRDLTPEEVAAYA